MILNYNGLRWLPGCLSSVAETKYSGYEVYLIDNASVDGSVEFVREKYSSVGIIQNSSNLGLPEAYNRAISQIDTDYVVLLNSDTEILNPLWLDSLVRIADGDAEVGAVAIKMVSMEDHRRLDSVGGMGIPYWRGFVDIGSMEPDIDQYQAAFEPFAFCGGAALIRKSAFVDAGLFDGKYFLYFEDVDLSWRLRLLGWKIRYAPEAKVAHYSGGSTGGRELNTLRLYYCHRNFLRSIIKNCGTSRSWALRNYLLFSLLTISGFLCINQPRNAIAVLKALAWNLRSLRSTYAARLRVQSRRKVSEEEVLRHMYPKLPRYQPPSHRELRRVLNALFERPRRV